MTLVEFLQQAGFVRRHDRWILDRWNTEIYLICDTGPDDDRPAAYGSENVCDVYIAPVGAAPRDSEARHRVLRYATWQMLSCWLLTLGPNSLPAQTQHALFQLRRAMHNMLGVYLQSLAPYCKQDISHGPLRAGARGFDDTGACYDLWTCPACGAQQRLPA